jgi:hypothetical protein
MKALSVKQPFASWLIEGIKLAEHRTYPAKFRGDVVIHSSKLPDAEFCFEYGLDLSKSDLFPFGCLLGIVEIYDCIDLGLGIFAWKVRNPRLFIVPVPMKGRLGFWDVEDEIIKKLVVV